MKVIYSGPGDTYHPQLGKLIAGEPFELDDKEAEKYIESGLLKAESKERRAENKDPKIKSGAFVTPAKAAPETGKPASRKNKKTKIKEEKSDGQSTNR